MTILFMIFKINDINEENKRNIRSNAAQMLSSVWLSLLKIMMMMKHNANCSNHLVLRKKDELKLTIVASIYDHWLMFVDSMMQIKERNWMIMSAVAKITINKWMEVLWWWRWWCWLVTSVSLMMVCRRKLNDDDQKKKLNYWWWLCRWW